MARLDAMPSKVVSTANNHTFWYEGDDEYSAAAAKVGGEVRRSTFLFRSRRYARRATFDRQ